MTKVLTQGIINQLDLSGVIEFSRLRRYPGFSSSEITAILHADLLTWLSNQGKCRAIVNDDARVTALTCIHPIEWDSAHFSIPMLRLQMQCSTITTIEQCRQLAIATLSDAMIKPGDHISTEVDIDDYNTLNGLLSLGFQILDLRRTYCTNRMRQDIDFLRMRSRVRHYEPSDYEAVISLARKTSFPSRFTRDPHIAPEKTSAMYEKWFHNLLNSPSSNAVVYERNGKVVACGAIGEIDFGYAGLVKKIRTGSLYAGGRDAVGAYPPVLYQLIIEALESHGLVDTTVSMNNVTVCRVLEGFRSYKSAAASYSLRLIAK